MTTFSGGNGVAYNNRFLDLRPETQNLVNNSTLMKYDENNASEKTDVDTSNEDTPVLDIVINNVVCSFNVRCHLNLRQIALQAANVEYRRENGMVTMKIRKPLTTASIWSSGRITCTGSTSDADAKKASRKFARILQKLGFRVRFTNFRVVNVLGTCIMPFGINLNKFTEKHRGIASYEPELHPGATYKIKELKATLKIFTTGSITITAPCVENVQGAVEQIFPLVYEFKTIKPAYRNNTDKLNSSVFLNRNPCLKPLAPPVVQVDSDDSDEDSVNQMDSDASCG